MNNTMKRIALILFFLITFCTIEAQSVIKYTTANLNLREGDGTEYRILTVLPQGTPVKLEEDCDCTWIPVSYNGYVGYISAKYLSDKRIVTTNNHGPVKYYTNSKGNRVQSPTYYDSRPAGATALCRDGTYSFSQSRRGTCSHHGGVAKWF